MIDPSLGTPQHSALRSLRVSVLTWVVEAGSVERAAKERGLTAIRAPRRLALQDFEKRLRPVVAYIRPLPLDKLMRECARNQTANHCDQIRDV